MKFYKTILVLTLFILLLASCSKDNNPSDVSEIPLTFQKTFDKGLYDTGTDLLELDTGDFILLDRGSNISYYKTDIIKTDKDGNELWEKEFSEAGFSLNGMSIFEVEGGFVLGGINNETSAPFLIGMDEEGNETWRNSYLEDIPEQYVSSIIKTSDGRIVISSSSRDDSYFSITTTLLTLNLNGNQISRVTLENQGLLPFFMCESDNGSFVLAGETSHYDSDSMAVQQVNSSGEISWFRTYKLENGLKGPSGICGASDGGYYIMGGPDPYSNETKPFFLMKIDNEGQEEWFKTYHCNIRGKDVIETSDNCIIATGVTYSIIDETYYSSLSFIKAGSDGELLDLLQYNLLDSNSGSGIIETSDGGYAIIGTTYAYDSDNVDVLFLKTDSYGMVE